MLSGPRPRGCSGLGEPRPALSLGGQATAWQCSPGPPAPHALQASSSALPSPPVSAPQLLAFSPGKEQAAGVWDQL